MEPGVDGVEEDERRDVPNIQLLRDLRVPVDVHVHDTKLAPVRHPHPRYEALHAPRRAGRHAREKDEDGE